MPSYLKLSTSMAIWAQLGHTHTHTHTCFVWMLHGRRHMIRLLEFVCWLSRCRHALFGPWLAKVHHTNRNSCRCTFRIRLPLCPSASYMERKDDSFQKITLLAKRLAFQATFAWQSLPWPCFHLSSFPVGIRLRPGSASSATTAEPSQRIAQLRALGLAKFASQSFARDVGSQSFARVAGVLPPTKGLVKTPIRLPWKDLSFWLG